MLFSPEVSSRVMRFCDFLNVRFPQKCPLEWDFRLVQVWYFPLTAGFPTSRYISLRGFGTWWKCSFPQRCPLEWGFGIWLRCGFPQRCPLEWGFGIWLRCCFPQRMCSSCFEWWVLWFVLGVVFPRGVGFPQRGFYWMMFWEVYFWVGFWDLVEMWFRKLWREEWWLWIVVVWHVAILVYCKLMLRNVVDLTLDELKGSKKWYYWK